MTGIDNCEEEVYNMSTETELWLRVKTSVKVYNMLISHLIGFALLYVCTLTVILTTGDGQGFMVFAPVTSLFLVIMAFGISLPIIWLIIFPAYCVLKMPKSLLVNFILGFFTCTALLIGTFYLLDHEKESSWVILSCGIAGGFPGGCFAAMLGRLTAISIRRTENAEWRSYLYE